MSEVLENPTRLTRHLISKENSNEAAKLTNTIPFRDTRNYLNFLKKKFFKEKVVFFKRAKVEIDYDVQKATRSETF